ncbi:TIGR03619 family F420-dependent LLM class oxidoreductase [Actinokineospora iranica]|uniref:TIGR03619 family F420-dependent LLM class oxidoreductase n=1 Tax=Actinokineospora iranica TaxID=1271860 RepID=UPI000B81FB99|nr:TIGR03619 family F420-dependent LLM class oxidoreductase [Actinokineospora iranica]
MKIGFAAPVSGSWATVDNLALVAAKAEGLGYDSLWTFQRLLSPPDASWGEAYRAVLDPVATLGFLAARTSRIRIGVAVLNLPFFAPPLLAKQLATVDLLSGGRLDAGLGIGWSDEEYTAVGVDKRDRGKRAEEYLPLLRRFWTDEVVDHDGEFYRVPPTRMDPKPVQAGGPPILVGAGAEPALRRAGRLADGWVSSSRADLSSIGKSVRTIRTAAEEAGRDPAALRMVCRGAVRVRSARADRQPLTGTFEQIRADFADLAEQGVTELFVDLNFDPEIGSPDAGPAESMRRAEDALEAFAP